MVFHISYSPAYLGLVQDILRHSESNTGVSRPSAVLLQLLVISSPVEDDFQPSGAQEDASLCV